MPAIIQPSGRKQKYLNNKDLLSEIHKSKASFSSYSAPEYKQYDIILSNLSEITEETLDIAKKNRAKRLGLEKFVKFRKAGDKKHRLIDLIPNYQEIPKTDLIIRIMTYDHIPLSPNRKKTVKSEADRHEKVNFPPYQHWKFDCEDQLICVGKSHWCGGLHNGYFSKEHGRITETLGKMFIKLSEKYSQRSNWRNYTYVEEMRGQSVLQLSQIGLQFDESKGENPFAYFTAVMSNSFTRILNLEKKSQNIRDDLLEESGLTPSMTRQYSQEFAGEVARQAKLYRNQRMPKDISATDDEQSANEDV